MKKGSLTVFATLSLMLIAQFIFVMLEGARYQEAIKLASINANASLESVMAQYCKPLWQEYHLLGYDTGDFSGERNMDQIWDEFQTITEKSKGKNLLISGLGSVNTNSYTLLSDNSGNAYVAAVGAYMKENLIYEEAKIIYSYYKSIKSIKEGDTYDDSYIDDAIDALEKKDEDSGTDEGDGKNNSDVKKELKERLTINTNSGKSKEEESDEKKDSTLNDIKEAKATGILAMVLPGDEKVSTAALKPDNYTRRTHAAGLNPTKYDLEWYNRVLMSQYFSAYMSNYRQQKNHALRYELEYIIGGRDCDRDNLEKVVGELLLIRECANMLYLLTDQAKCAEALAMATAIAGATVNPLIIEAVKLGLLAAWAFCESILDLRALMDGKRIPVIKSCESWTSGLSGLTELLEGKAQAKSTGDDLSSGLNYQEYLAILVLFGSDKTLSDRAMAAQESTIRAVKGYEGLKMDNLLIDTRVEAVYEWQPVFGKMVGIIKGPGKSFTSRARVDYSYCENTHKK